MYALFELLAVCKVLPHGIIICVLLACIIALIFIIFFSACPSSQPLVCFPCLFLFPSHLCSRLVHLRPVFEELPYHLLWVLFQKRNERFVKPLLAGERSSFSCVFLSYYDSSSFFIFIFIFLFRFRLGFVWFLFGFSLVSDLGGRPPFFPFS